MQPKKMGEEGASGGPTSSSACDDEGMPQFLAPPPPCGHGKTSPSPTEETQSYNFMLFKAIKVLFVESITVNDFMDCDEISSLLTISEMEKVQTRLVQDGQCEAARLLLDFLKRKQGWFDRVLEALSAPWLKQLPLRRKLLSAKEKVDKHWQESRRSDVDGGRRGRATTPTPPPATPPPPDASGKSPTASQRPSPPTRSQSEPGDDRHQYAKVEDPASLGPLIWFHGTLSREAAERILDGKNPGHFLVRRSPTCNRYALSFRNRNRVVHVVIDERADTTGRICYSLGEDNTVRFSTVIKLIDHYGANTLRVAGEDTPTCLSKPVARRFQPT